MFYVPFQHLVGENDGETQRGTHVREDEGWKNGCPATVCASPMPMYHAVFIIHTQLWCSLLLLGLASHHSLTHSLVLFFFFFFCAHVGLYEDVQTGVCATATGFIGDDLHGCKRRSGVAEEYMYRCE